MEKRRLFRPFFSVCRSFKAKFSGRRYDPEYMLLALLEQYIHLLFKFIFVDFEQISIVRLAFFGSSTHSNKNQHVFAQFAKKNIHLFSLSNCVFIQLFVPHNFDIAFSCSIPRYNTMFFRSFCFCCFHNAHAAVCARVLLPKPHRFPFSLFRSLSSVFL